MSLQKLVAAFAAKDQLPIEIPEVRDAVIALGFQDSIIFSGQAADPGKCRGVFYQYTTRPRPYAEPVLTTLIVYNTNLPVPWQRVICCKEAVHLMDHQVEKARTSEDVQGLLDKLLGPMSTEDYGLADLMAAHDRLALYQCLPILFPDAARAAARAKLAAGEKTTAEIIDWAQLPEPLARMVMDDNWPALQKDLMSC